MNVLKWLVSIFFMMVFPGLSYGQGGVLSVCDRTPQVKDAIMQKITDSIDENITCSLALPLLKYILSLDLDRRDIRSLKPGDFSGLGRLDALYLSGNQLTSLPVGIFDGLVKLEDFDLSYNQLTSLPAGIFDGLVKLEDFDLSYNQLTSLPAGIFDELFDLEYINLSYNQLTSLPVGVFNTQVVYDLDFVITGNAFSDAEKRRISIEFPKLKQR